MESHDPYGRLKRAPVVSCVHSTDPIIRSSSSPSVMFHSPTGARSIPDLLQEIQTELNAHPCRDALKSYCTMVISSLRAVRENLRQGNVEAVSVELYRLGVWVERMRGELHPSRGTPPIPLATMKEDVDACDRIVADFRLATGAKTAEAWRKCAKNGSLPISRSTYFEYKRKIS